MTFLYIALGILPSLAWLFFFLKEDIHPEPKKMISLVFLYGALVTIIAYALQSGLRDYLSILSMPAYGFLTFLIFATIEEILKFLAAYGVMNRNKYLDEPVDAMIYMITAGLGFAMLENVAIVNTGSLNLSSVLGIITLRFIGATLLHALCSGIVGYAWAKSIIKHSHHKITFIVTNGIILASVLHGIFNYLIIRLKDVMIYPTIFLVIIAFLVFWDFEKIKGSTQKLELQGE